MEKKHLAFSDVFQFHLEELPSKITLCSQILKSYKWMAAIEISWNWDLCPKNIRKLTHIYFPFEISAIPQDFIQIIHTFARRHGATRHENTIRPVASGGPEGPCPPCQLSLAPWPPWPLLAPLAPLAPPLAPLAPPLAPLGPPWPPWRFPLVALLVKRIF